MHKHNYLFTLLLVTCIFVQSACDKKVTTPQPIDVPYNKLPHGSIELADANSNFETIYADTLNPTLFTDSASYSIRDWTFNAEKKFLGFCIRRKGLYYFNDRVLAYDVWCDQARARVTTLGVSGNLIYRPQYYYQNKDNPQQDQLNASVNPKRMGTQFCSEHIFFKWMDTAKSYFKINTASYAYTASANASNVPSNAFQYAYIDSAVNAPLLYEDVSGNVQRTAGDIFMADNIGGAYFLIRILPNDSIIITKQTGNNNSTILQNYKNASTIAIPQMQVDQYKTYSYSANEEQIAFAILFPNNKGYTFVIDKVAGTCKMVLNAVDIVYDSRVYDQIYAVELNGNLLYATDNDIRRITATDNTSICNGKLCNQTADNSNYKTQIASIKVIDGKPYAFVWKIANSATPAALRSSQFSILSLK
ncbi:MAG: hypothetical protein RL660_1134 [Bacteroidota bacterium]|jgi:hypothetical protein